MRKTLFLFLALFLAVAAHAQSCPTGYGVALSSRDAFGGLHAVKCSNTQTGDVFWLGAAFGNGFSIVDATKEPGADFSEQVNSAHAKVLAAGGGIVDAHGFACQYPLSCGMTQNIVIGSATVPNVKLILPNGGWITRDTGKQFRLHSTTSLIGNGTIIYGDDTVAAITEAFEAGGIVHAIEVSGVQIFNTPTNVGSIGLQVGGAITGGNVDVIDSTFSDVLAQNNEVGIQLSGPGGCTCYNKFYGVSALNYGGTVGVRVLTGSNKNEWYSLKSNHNPLGLYDHGTANHYYSPDFENDTASWNLFGNETIIDAPYEEASGAGVFGAGAVTNKVLRAREYAHPVDSSTNTSNYWSPINGTAMVAALTGQGADVGAATIFAVPAQGQGKYQVCVTITETTAAGVTSTLPAANVIYTNAIDSVAKTLPLTAIDAGNATTISHGGCASVNAKLSTNIQYSTTGYLSNAGGAMKFALEATVEAQ